MKITQTEFSTIERAKVVNDTEEFKVSVEWKFEKKKELPPVEEIERWLDNISNIFKKNVLLNLCKAKLDNQGQDLKSEIAEKG